MILWKRPLANVAAVNTEDYYWNFNLLPYSAYTKVLKSSMTLVSLKHTFMFETYIDYIYIPHQVLFKNAKCRKNIEQAGSGLGMAVPENGSRSTTYKSVFSHSYHWQLQLLLLAFASLLESWGPSLDLYFVSHIPLLKPGQWTGRAAAAITIDSLTALATVGLGLNERADIAGPSFHCCHLRSSLEWTGISSYSC